MTKAEIKFECEELYDIIKSSQERLEELRNICKHKDTSVGNYSWRVGSIQPAEICSICGKVIKLITPEPVE